MRIRSRALLTLGIVFPILLIFIYLTTREIILGGFEGVERDLAIDTIEGELVALDHEISVLGDFTKDWAGWDDTFLFAAGRNEHYVKANLAPSTFANLGIDYFIILDIAGRPILAVGTDHETGEKNEVPESIFPHLDPTLNRGSRKSEPFVSMGVLVVPEHPLIVSTQPVLRSDGSGPPNGILIMAKRIDRTILSSLSGHARHPVTVSRITGVADGDFRTAIENLSKEVPIVTRRVSDDLIAAYTLITDIHGEPALVLRTEMARTVFAQGVKTLRYHMASLLAVCAFFGLVAVILLERNILGRIVGLSRDVARVRSEGDVTARIEMEGGDEIAGLAGSINEMLDSEERLRELALRESEGRFRAVFEQNEDVVLILGGEATEVLDANEAASAFLGASREEIVSGGLEPFVEPGEWTDWQKNLSGGGLGERMVRLRQKALHRRDGERYVVEVHGTRIRMEGREVIYCSIKDITERMKIEEIWRVAVRKLVEAEKMSFLGTIVSGFAHDINNPNQMIGVNIELLADTWKDTVGILDRCRPWHEGLHLAGLPYDETRGAVAQAIEDVRTGSERIAEIIRNLIQFSKGDRSEMSEEIDIDRAVENAVTMLRHRIKEHTSRFSCAPGGGIPVFQGNRLQVEQTIINLIVNALESLPSRDRGVRVSTGFDPGQVRVTVSVADEGVGMSPETIEAISQPFVTTKGERGGAGLGLALSRIFVREPGGEITFESEPGRGTIVTVSFPLRVRDTAGGDIE